jgi:hypothetical protein
LKYLKTKTELSARAGCDVKTITRWTLKADFPARTKDGWPALAFDRFAARMLKAAAARQSGVNSDLKRAKLDKQVTLLEIGIRRAERQDEAERVEHGAKMDQYATRQEVSDLCRHFSWTFDQAVQAVAMITRDAAIEDAVRERFDNLRRRLSKWLETEHSDLFSVEQLNTLLCPGCVKKIKETKPA